jgi:hypothetical protein
MRVDDTSGFRRPPKWGSGEESPKSTPKTESESKAQKDAPKKSDLPLGVLRWTDSVAGYSAERIQQCLIYQQTVSRNPFWISIIGSKGRGFLSQPNIIVKLVGDTPEDYVYDPDAVIGWKRKHIEGLNQPVVEKYVRRNPRNDEERELVRNTFGVTPHTRKLLAKPDCQRCKGKGSYTVRPYPDNPNLTANQECDCPEE